MLSDIELFIVTWVLAGISFISLLILMFSSFELYLHKTKQRSDETHAPYKFRLSEKKARRVRDISVLMIVVGSIAGMIIDYVNWIPVTQYDDSTFIFRIARAPFGTFGFWLFFGGVLIYACHRASKEDQIQTGMEDSSGAGDPGP